MNPQILELAHGKPIKMWTEGVPVDEGAKRQLIETAKLPIIFSHLAVMPDVHQGKGSTIGSVIPTIGAIIPAAVGVDLGCFTGDTLIPLLDGKSYPIHELAKENKEITVYACSASGRIIAARARALKTRDQANLVQVTLDNGKKIHCTPDHRFMLRNGEWCEAGQLVPGTSLMPLYRESDKENYTLVQQPYSGRMQKAHWIVARSGLLGEVPKFAGQRTVIHHINFDSSNNSPDNLKFMGSQDHSSYHRSLVERNRSWQSEEFEKRRKQALANKAKTPDGYAYMAERGTKNILQYMQNRTEHFKQAVVDNGKRGKQYLIAYNQSERGKNKSREIANRLFACETCGEKVKGGFGLHSHRRWVHGYNHTVIAVTPLTEQAEVYCLQVPEYHNFALEAGVFVHNCGMMAMQTSLSANDLPDHLGNIRNAIEIAVPHGRSSGRGGRDKGSWHNPPASVSTQWGELEPGFMRITAKYPRLKNTNNYHHLGTLGTGNHFIEVCLDEAQQVWMMLHSGSRGVGNAIGEMFIALAQKDMNGQQYHLPNRDLAYFEEGSQYFDDYVFAVGWAQDFARRNRVLMMKRAMDALQAEIKKPFKTEVMAVNCHHNYVQRETHFGQSILVTRKGAVSAQKGQLGIIPGSMGAKSFIVRGLGNADSFCSCSHGAGRVMSRTAAKKRYTVEDQIRATADVECRKDADVIDEIPMAYKDIDAVMAAQSALVEIVHSLKQVVCVKG